MDVKVCSHVLLIQLTYNLYLQEYSFQITLRQQWNDNRLIYREKLEENP